MSKSENLKCNQLLLKFLLTRSELRWNHVHLHTALKVHQVTERKLCRKKTYINFRQVYGRDVAKVQSRVALELLTLIFTEREETVDNRLLNQILSMLSNK